MKIIHTADLHLGVRFKNVVPRPATEGFEAVDIRHYVNKRTLENLNKAVEYALKKDVDLLIIAGDVFETIESSLEYHTELARSLQPLLDKGVNTVIIGGNHDYIRSPRRKVSLALLEDLKYPNLIFKSKLDIRNSFQGDEPYEVELDGGTVGLVLMPYFWVFKKEYPKAIRLYISKMLSRLGNVDYRLLIAHLDVVGAVYRESDFIGSFRSIEKVNLSTIYPDRFDYIALGHIHIPQKIADNIWYSGSLNKLNFGEYMDKKAFLYIEFRRRPTINPIYVEPVKMNVYSVKLDDVEINWSNLRSRLEDVLSRGDNLDAVIKLIFKVRSISDYRLILRSYERRIQEILWSHGVAGYYIKPEYTGVSDMKISLMDLELSRDILIKDALKNYISKLPYNKDFKEELYRHALKYLGVEDDEDKA